MVTVCWAAKGGAGTTVVAALLALRAGRPALLVDLDGELPSTLGVAAPDRPGIADWMASDAPPDHLADLVVELTPSASLLPLRIDPRPPNRPAPHLARVPEALGWLREWERANGGTVVVDAGTGEPQQALLGAERSLLVTRNCYVAVNRATRSAHTPGGILLVREPGRALTAREIEIAVGAPVVACLEWEPGIARACDIGLLHGRHPRAIDRELRRAAA